MDDLNKEVRAPEQITKQVLHALQKEYVVVGKTHVRAWHAWLLIGLIAGIVAGITLVANRSGKFEPSSAAGVAPVVFGRVAVPSNTLTSGARQSLYRFSAVALDSASIISAEFNVKPRNVVASDSRLTMYADPGFSVPLHEGKLLSASENMIWVFGTDVDQVGGIPGGQQRYFELTADLRIEGKDEATLAIEFTGAQVIFKQKPNLPVQTFSGGSVVSKPMMIRSFRANPATAASGESVVISMNVENAANLEITMKCQSGLTIQNQQKEGFFTCDGKSSSIVPDTKEVIIAFVNSTKSSRLVTVAVTAYDASGKTQKRTANVLVRPAAKTSPSITVLSPNGGEKLIIGTMQNIKWSSSGLTQNHRVYISARAASPESKGFPMGGVSGDQTSFEYSVNVAPEAVGKFYELRLCVVPPSSSITDPFTDECIASDFSDKPFSIIMASSTDGGNGGGEGGGGGGSE